MLPPPHHPSVLLVVLKYKEKWKQEEEEKKAKGVSKLKNIKKATNIYEKLESDMSSLVKLCLITFFQRIYVGAGKNLFYEK